MIASLAATGTPHYAELVTLLALMVDATLVAIGLLRAGWLATSLSIPVTTGSLTAANSESLADAPLMRAV